MSFSVDQILRKAKFYTKKGEFALAKQKYQAVLEKYPMNKRAIEGMKVLRDADPLNKNGLDRTQEDLEAMVSRSVDLHHKGEFVTRRDSTTKYYY